MKDHKTTLASDLAKLPDPVRKKLFALLAEVSKFSTQAQADPAAFRGAYGLLKLLGPVAGLSEAEIARISNSSPATFTRWQCAEDVPNPHTAHVQGVLDGLGRVSEMGASELLLQINERTE